jgi:DNA-binding FadR family transcriptional regulator|nr:GntR family transcriptional regulator [Kofleriaceae bacterium]
MTVVHLTPTPEPDAESEPVSESAIDLVFEALLRDIVSGKHPAGARLPAERELSRQLGASRPTLREALRRLGEWQLVEPRRGSGVVVRPYRDWSIEVIGAYLRHGRPEPGQPTLARMLLDLFAIRRAMVIEMIRLVGPRVPAGGTRDARAAMARAWSMRNEASYAIEDFQVMRRVAECAQFTPGLWLLNRFASLYLEAAASIRAIVRPPDDYVQTHTKLFDLLESHRTDEAAALMSDYLDRHDAALVGALQGAA